MTETKWYFFKLVHVGGKVHVKPLENQSLEEEGLSGIVHVPISSEANVQCDKAIRTKVPIHTILASNKLLRVTSFYKAGEMFTLEKIDGCVQAPVEAVIQYTNLITKRVVEKPAKDLKESSTRRSYLTSLKKSDEYAPPTVEENGFYVNPEIWYLVVRNALKNIPTMFVGPTGTGKTELVSLVAKAIGKGYEEIDMGAMIDPISGLLGTHRISSEGTSEFDYAKFTQIIKGNNLVLLDELSRSAITANNILFPTLDKRRYLPIEVACSDGERNITMHEDCVIFATANIGGEYSGTNTIDKALLDRFFIVEMDYLSEFIEVDLLIKRTKVPKSSAELIIKIASTIRSLYTKGEISTAVSTRHTLSVASMIKDGFETLFALQQVFLPLFEGTIIEGERGIINNILLGK